MKGSCYECPPAIQCPTAAVFLMCTSHLASEDHEYTKVSGNVFMLIAIPTIQLFYVFLKYLRLKSNIGILDVSP